MAQGGTKKSSSALSLTDRELFDRLRWFTYVRWAFGLFCLALLLVSWYVLGIRFRAADGTVTMAPAVHVVLLLFLGNAVFTLVVRIVRAQERITRRRIEWIALAQVVCDLVVICILVHCTGGVENFFVIMVLVPLVIVTELLPQRVAYATAGLAVVLLNAVGWGEQQGILPHVQVELAGRAPAAAPGHFADPYYVLHVTAALTVTIFAMVFVASTIAARLRRREHELEETYRQLNLADEWKSFFMRQAGHEMRAPLAAIHSILDAISHTAHDLRPEQQALIDRAKLRSRGMMALVKDLLRYSRLRAPREELARSPVDLGAIVTDTVELMTERAQAVGLAMSCRVEPAPVAGEEELLRELVTNLVTNAIQYTPPGGRIEVRLAAAHGSARLSVADTGIGIPEETRGRIFEEFYRTPEAKNTFQDGTGLGLAIVRRIVELHRGSIEAAPRSEGGTVFTVILPLRGVPVTRQGSRAGCSAS
jgi:signal transduction histidine kinase